MGTTHRQPDYSVTASSPSTGSPPAQGAPGEGSEAGAWELSPEQVGRYDEARDWVRQRLLELERMGPAERAAADAEWGLLRDSMNGDRARAGARPLFVDER